MNTDEIVKHFSKDKRFLGVFAADKVPPKVPLNHGAIINLDTSQQVGSHWVGVYKSVILEYFDPFGKPPPAHLHLETPMLYSTKKVQDTDSISCGKFAIYFVKQRLKGESFASIQNLWSSNKIFNDLLV